MIDLRDPSTPPESVRQALGLQPHPEGGSYREIWRDTPADGPRGAVSTIMFLLAAGSGRTGTELTRRKSGAGRGQSAGAGNRPACRRSD